MKLKLRANRRNPWPPLVENMKLYQRAPRKATSFGKNGVTAWHRFGKGGKNLGKEISEGEWSPQPSKSKQKLDRSLDEEKDD